MAGEEIGDINTKSNQVGSSLSRGDYSDTEAFDIQSVVLRKGP